MKRTSFFILFIALIFPACQQLSAQITLKGRTSIQPEDFYYVTLLSPKDSTLITFQFFDTPEFEMKDLKYTEFILQITSPVLYKTYSCQYGILNDSKVIDTGYIVLKPEVKSLGEVEVIGSQPKLRFTDGKLIYNIQNNADFRRLTSLDDVLRRVPFLSLEDNKISVFGKKNTVVLINGILPKNDNWELISPEDIKEIEIITNPSAEYNSNGMAVINIITRKQFVRGFNGQLSSSASKGKYWRSNNMLQLGYATSNINIYTNLNYNPNQRQYIETYERYFPEGISMFNTLEQKRNTDKSHSLVFGLDYLIHPCHNIGIQYQNVYWKPTRNTLNINDLYTGAEVERFSNLMKGDFMNNKNIYDLSYNYQIDSVGKNLSVNLGYVDYSSHENNNIDVTSTNGQSNKTTHAEANIKLFTTNIDYEHKTNQGFIGRTGVYFSHSQNNSFYQMTNGNNSITDDITPHNGADINENKLAGYVTGRKNWNKFHIAAGLRFEYVNYKNTDKPGNKNSKTYNDLFPSLEIGYQANEKLQTNLSFSRKVLYPSFQNLDPSTQYVDTFTYYVGNVNLQPEYSYNIDMNFIYNKLITLSLGYSKIENPINAFFVKRLNPNSIICLATAENLKSQRVWNASLAAPFQYKFWTMQNAVGLTYNDIRFENEGVAMNRKKAMAYIYTYQGLRLPLDFNFSVTYQYNSSGVSGVFYHKDRHIVNCAINKSFLSNKLTFTLKYDDIFNGNKQKVWTEIHGIKFSQNTDYENSYATFAIRYKFGRSIRKYEMKDNSKESLKRIQ